MRFFFKVSTLGSLANAHLADNYIALHTSINYFILVFLCVLLQMSRALQLFPIHVRYLAKHLSISSLNTVKAQISTELSITYM